MLLKKSNNNSIMDEIQQTFQFIVNKIDNNTFQIMEIMKNTNSSLSYNNPITQSPLPSLTTNASHFLNETSNFYDSSGAAKYIVVVILVYGFGIIFFIGSQVRSTKKISDDVDEANAEKILRSMETEIFTREVLEKLSNKDHRDKAWRIYLGESKVRRSSQAASMPQLHSENLLTDSFSNIDKDAVENIQKKLKLLNKVQSGYKGRDNTYVETLNEVLVNKHKRIHNVFDQKSHDEDTRSKSLRNIFRKTFKRNNNKDKITYKKYTNGSERSAPPLLILQTDDDGLQKLRESRKCETMKLSKYNNINDQKLLNSSIRSDDTLKFLSNSVSFDLSDSKSSINSLNQITNIENRQNNNNNNRNDLIVSFDKCEISQQITTV